MSTKIKIIISVIIILIIGGLFAAWRITSTKLSSTQKELTETTLKLESANKENENLTQYMKKKDIEIKAIEKEYANKLSSIPADICGDSKPSKELLEYFIKEN